MLHDDSGKESGVPFGYENRRRRKSTQLNIITERMRVLFFDGRKREKNSTKVPNLIIPFLFRLFLHSLF